MKLIIDVKVIDLNRAIIFYNGVLGLPCRIQEQNWAAISVGDAEIHLYINGGTTGHVELYVDDIDAEVKKLNQRGVVFLSGKDKPEAISVDENNVTTFPWGRIAFFKDSEGNELAIARDA